MENRVSILGFGIDNLTLKEAADEFEKLFEKDGFSLVVTANPEILNSASKNKELAGIIQKSTLVVADGMSLVKLSNIKHTPLKERVAGIDFAFEALKRCAKLNKKVFLLGAKPGVAKTAAENLRAMIPSLLICGVKDGYFKDDEWSLVVEEINASGADFIIAAMGCPKQEIFLSKNADALNAKVGVGVGGSLDVWSGNIKRAPQFYIDHNIEWLYRLAKEPKRFSRMAKIPVFMLKAIFDK